MNSLIQQNQYASMVELADTTDSKSVDRNIVPVQIWLEAPSSKIKNKGDVKMKIEEMSKELLELEIAKSKIIISDLKKTLGHFPESSILSRLSIKAYLKKEERRLRKLENELKKRV